MFDLQDVLLVDAVDVCNRTGFKNGVELNRHAETAEDHVSIAVLAPKCLVGDFETRGAVDRPVNPGHLQTTHTSVQTNLPVLPFTHRYMVVVLGDVDKSGQTLAEPHGDLPVHVDGERFEAFLESTHGVILEGAGIFAQIHAAHLGQAKTADWNKPYSPVRERGGNIKPLRKQTARSRNLFSFFQRQFSTGTLNKVDFITGSCLFFFKDLHHCVPKCYFLCIRRLYLKK